MYNELKRYTNKVKSFHMPGHKNGKLQLIEDLYSLDVTEVPGTDDLHHPTSIIKEVQDRIGHIYQSYQSYLLINGSTSGILATMATIARQKGSVLVSRNCHKSVYNGLLIHRLDAHYIYPNYEDKYGFYGKINPKDLTDMLEKYPDIHSVILTSPTYEGIVSDIQEISRIVHNHGARLIVDEAHGAHLSFSEFLPYSALELGADYVIQSTHKTLPCLTQTALLHVNPSVKNELDWLEENLAIYQSSSPSYILMSSIEKGVEFMQEHREDFSRWIIGLDTLLKNNPIQGGYWLYEDKNLHEKIHIFDMTRLTFIINVNMTGYVLSEQLRSRYNIQVELAGEKHIVAIVTMADSLEDIKHLLDAINKCLSCTTNISLLNYKKNTFALPKEQAQQIVPMHMAKQEEHWKKIPYQKAVGYIARDMIIPYPPGIPLILPGERISQPSVDYIDSLIKQGRDIYGIIEGEIHVLLQEISK